MVKEKSTTLPLEGAQVIVTYRGDSDLYAGVSATDGTFRITGVFAISNQWPVLRAKKPYYKLQGLEPLELRADALELSRTLEMVRSVTVSGIVKMPDGQPAPAALVTALIPTEMDV
jgi:hypothetical protein